MNVEKIVSWFRTAHVPRLSADETVRLLNTMHPRTIFIKSLPYGSRVLDLGAGEGSLEVLRNWLAPKRPDLRMYAFSLSKGQHFDAYDGYELGNWDRDPPGFPDVNFDAVFCSHFIEHIADPHSLCAWAAGRLATEGRVYLEWPAPNSKLLPSKSALAEAGVNLMIANFYDDATHKDIPDRKRLVEAFEGCGFDVDLQGYVTNPYLENELIAHFKGVPNSYEAQSAFWSRTRWAQYLVARRL